MTGTDKLLSDFSSLLLELLESEIPLKNSLEVMRDTETVKNRVRLLSGNILEKLSEGCSFAIAVASNGAVSVPERFVTLIAASESAGNLTRALTFIKDFYNRKQETEERIKNVSIYPAIVVTAALTGSFLLVHYRNSFLGAIPESEIFSGVFTAVSVLIAGVAAVALYVKKAMGENVLYSVFYSLGFLTESGFDFARSIDIAILYAAGEREITKALFTVKEKLAEGMSSGKAFGCCPKVFSKDMIARLELAEVHGNTARVCSGIATRLEERDKAKRSRCMQLIEPLLILCTGLYILILVETVILPFITDFGGVL